MYPSFFLLILSLPLGVSELIILLSRVTPWSFVVAKRLMLRDDPGPGGRRAQCGDGLEADRFAQVDRLSRLEAREH